MKKTLLCFLSILSITSITFASSELPDIGSSSSQVFSLIEEQAVGDDYMRQLRAFAPIVNDAEINDYIQHLGFKLVENNRNAENRQFSFFVVNQDSINAFAMPGGYIGINTGLITRTDTESELASVLGHEIAHVTQRHLARRLELSKQLTIPRLAVFVAAILVASQAKNTETGMGALMGAQGLAQQALINHTRSNEAEADRIGIDSLYKAGFDPAGAISFFEKMQTNKRYTSEAYEFLSTHPLSRSRITDARLRASEYPKRKLKPRPIYELMKEKIKALTLPVDPITINQLMTQYNENQIHDPAQLYGFAIYMGRAKKFDLAEKVLKQLQFSNPRQPSYAIALAQLNIERKTPDNSVDEILSLLVKSPGNQALIETLAELYIVKQEFAKARDLLLANIHMTKHAPYLLKLLSEAQQGAGFKSEVYETEGNFLLAMGDLAGARMQFEQALNYHTEDPYARARINSHIDKIKEYIRQRSLRH